MRRWLKLIYCTEILGGEIMSFFEHVYDAVTELRENLYQQNFWDSSSHKDYVEPENMALIAPTPLEEQVYWLAPYESGAEFLHDLYSILYKPLTLIYSACRLLLQSGWLAIQCVSSIYASLINLLPSLVSHDDPEADSIAALDGEELGQTVLGSLATLTAAILTMSVYVPFDTISSILSVTLRPFATALNGLIECCSEDDNASQSYMPY